MASGGKGEIAFPSSSLVKYLNVAATAVGVVSIVLDVLVPVAQQLSKNKPAREGLDGAIRMTILLALVKSIPRLIGSVRKLRAQMSAEVVA